MSRQHKSPHIHKHLHYHYHYDVNQEPASSHEYTNQVFIKSPRHSQLLSDYSSWKNHINPEVTRLYEEMSDTESVRETRDPRHSRNYNRTMQDFYHCQNDQSNYLTQSRRQLLQNIQKYEEYLKQRQQSNIYTPNTVSLMKLGYPEHQQNEKYLSVKHFDKNRKSLSDIIRKKADSKIFYADKMYQSTTARDEETEICKESEMNPSMIRDVRRENVAARSQIKRPKNYFVLQNPKMGLSQIKSKPIQNNLYHHQQSSYHQPEQEAHNFSLFQQQPHQESFNQNKQPLYSNIYQNESNQLDKLEQEQYMLRKQKYESDHYYKYQLMKEECEYLRNKFIQHIEIIHGVKF